MIKEPLLHQIPAKKKTITKSISFTCNQRDRFTYDFLLNIQLMRTEKLMKYMRVRLNWNESV